MKNKTKLIALLAFFCFLNLNLSYSQAPVKIGENQGGYFVITKSLTTIKIQLETFIGNTMVLDTTTFEILYFNLDSTYLLIGSDTSGLNKVAVALDLMPNQDFYEAAAEGEGHTVTCSGCRVGCNPRKKKAFGDYYCTSCTVGTGCTKSETLGSYYVFF